MNKSEGEPMNFFDLNHTNFEVREDLKRLTILGGKSEFAMIERKATTEGLYNSHPSEQFVYLLEGKAEIRIGDETHTVEPNQAVFIPSDVPHGIKSPHHHPLRHLLCTNAGIFPEKIGGWQPGCSDWRIDYGPVDGGRFQ
jgi:quercetin dioxygenase-like cupin family protein